MKIAVMGAGGVGGFFGGRLARAGLDVTFIARGKHLEAIRANGLQVRSREGDFVVRPALATDKPAEVGPVDLILVCVKQYDADQAAEQIKPMVGPQTALIPVLNGIDHIERIGRAIGAQHVLGGAAVISALVSGPGVIEHVAAGNLAFGEIGGGISERCKMIQEALAVSKLRVVADPDILASMWHKFAGLTGGAVCSAVRGSYRVVLSTPETFGLLRQTAGETLAVGRAKGVAVRDSAIDDFIQVFAGSAVEFKPSMLVDLEHGRRLEVEWLNGTVSRYGKALGVPTPANDFIYACLKPWANGAATTAA